MMMITYDDIIACYLLFLSNLIQAFSGNFLKHCSSCCFGLAVPDRK